MKATKEISRLDARCPVCKRAASRAEIELTFEYNCRKCGTFRISSPAERLLKKELVGKKASRQAVARKIRRVASELGGAPTFELRTVEKLFATLDLPSRYLSPAVTLLSHLEGMSGPGGREFLDADCWSAIADVENPQCVIDLIEQLEADGLICAKWRGSTVSLEITEAGELRTHGVRFRLREKHPASKLRVRALQIKGSRCFGKRQSLDLVGPDGKIAQWTVLLGQNGVGKTTLLQAIALLFPIMQSEKKGPQLGVDLLRSRITEEQFHGPKKNDHMEIDLFCSTDSSDFQIGNEIATSTSGDASSSSRLTEVLLYEGDVLLQEGSSGSFTRAGSYVQGLPPLIVGYGAARLPTHMAFSAVEQKAGGSIDNLFNPNEPLRAAEDWLLRADYAARFSDFKDDETRKRLERVKASLVKILPDVKQIAIRAPDKDTHQPSVRFITAAGPQSMETLSLGYQTTLSWVVDLCARLFEYYPESSNPLQEPVVVLVDEIDLHLHPKWQRQIMAYLSRIFPRGQFIVTTHSPLVVQGVQDVNLAVLKREGADVVIRNDVDEVRNWRADQLLTSDLFDLETARPPYIEPLLRERNRLLTKAKLSEEDEDRLEVVNARLGELPTAETPQQSQAMELILRAARRLEK